MPASSAISPWFPHCPNVTIIHDLQHHHHPEFFKRSDLLAWRLLVWASANSSKRILTVSEASREDIHATYGIPLDFYNSAVQNLGGDPKFISESFKIPRTWRAGAAASRPLPNLQGRGTLTVEVRKARADNAHFHAGAEYLYRDLVALRVGGKFGYDDEKMSFGLGLAKNWIHFDYALVPLSSNLGTTHFFSLTGVF